uniref:Si:dkey-182g1.6 n=1 Tax=Cyprinus carpio TaxID=7962 RepID=A0A8C1P7N9_CYPCA
MSNPETLSFRMTYRLSFLNKTVMLKSFSKCKQTNFGTGGGLEQVNGLNSAADSRWSNIHLNNQTGDLTIRNIRMKQSGVYKVEINTINMIVHRKFRVTLGGMKNVSVMTGESIILLSGVLEIREYDLILWKFEDHLMAKISKRTNQFLLYDSAEGKFKGRLKLNREAGDLTISDSRSTDSGDYHLHMSNSEYTLQRTISVSVKVSGLHPGYIALICVCVVFVPVLVALVTYYCCKDHEII